MRPTKRFEKLLSDPSIDREFLKDLHEYECEICGVGPLESWVRFVSSEPHPKDERWADLWQNSYDVCEDCLEAGVASFPDRLWKHAQELEERARELQKLAAEAKWRISGPEDAVVCT
jgi:hypothetical protein